MNQLQKSSPSMADRNYLDITKHTMLNEYVVLEAIEIKEDGITSGLSNKEDRPDVGKIVNCDNVNLIGNVVFFSKYSTTTIEYNSKTYYILRYEDLYSVFMEQ